MNQVPSMNEPPNPWLALPLERYERHMQDVLQLDALSELFGAALEWCRPRSVAILGVAGGNGLERIDSAVTTRIVGVDINPSYVAQVRERYRNLPGLELHPIDLSTETAAFSPVQLTHAALIFEHAGVERCLDNALRMTAAGGHLSVVLQKPGAWERTIDGRQHSAGRLLGSDPAMLDPDWFSSRVAACGPALVHQTEHAVWGGTFWMGIFAVAR